MIPVIVIVLVQFCCLPCLLVYTIFFYGIQDRLLSNFYILQAQRKMIHFISLCRTHYVNKRMFLFFFKIYCYIMNQRNYLGQCLYIMLFCGGSILFFIYGFPHLDSRYVFPFTKYIFFIGHIICFFLFILTCTTDPGTINSSNALIYANIFQHDPYYFPSDKICSTCHIVKPAQSKHCRFCDTCKIKFDHHCIWLGNCIGYFNHGKFLFFLFVHTFYLSYGVIVLCQILYSDFVTNFVYFKNVFQLSFEETMQFFWIFLNFLVKRQLILSYLLLCCVTFSIILFIFFIIHLYQTFILQMTTNEIHKASQIIISDNSSYRSHRHRLPLKFVFLMIFFPHHALNQAKKSVYNRLPSNNPFVNPNQPNPM